MQFRGLFLIPLLTCALLGQNAQQVPERTVARISHINGDVSVRRGDSGEVVAATVNAPMVSDDRLLTSTTARAELQFDSANLIRVSPSVELRLGDLQFQRYQAQLAVGTITLRVLRPSNAQVEIDTPILGVHPLTPGIYRITVKDDGSTDLTVRQGEADVMTQRGAERVRAGATMLARGSLPDPEYQLVTAVSQDEWDRWNASRDQELLRSPSYQRVSPDINGYEDLDRNGRWLNDPQYGQVWAPNVGPGWAPYQAGSWVWEDYYGWTWVSYDPWGWAPYHYGRWFVGPAGWCWWPGPVYGRYYWSPALVAFFGFGGYTGFQAGFGFGFGSVGWVPLAPFESFHPWWGRGFYGAGFVNRPNVVANANLASMYRNARVMNGVTAVAANSFGRHVGQYQSLNGATIRDAGVVHGVLAVTPDRASLHYTSRPPRVAAVVSVRSTQFFGRSPTTSGPRISFEQQRRTMEQAARTSFTSPSPRGPAETGSGFAHGWERFGEPVHHVNPVGPAGYGAAGNGYSRGYVPAAPQRSAGGGQPVRIGPSIVRERPAAPPPAANRAPAGNGGRNSGGGHSHR